MVALWLKPTMFVNEHLHVFLTSIKSELLWQPSNLLAHLLEITKLPNYVLDTFPSSQLQHFFFYASSVPPKTPCPSFVLPLLSVWLPIPGIRLSAHSLPNPFAGFLPSQTKSISVLRNTLLLPWGRKVPTTLSTFLLLPLSNPSSYVLFNS